MREKTKAIKAVNTSLAESYKKVEEFYLQSAQAYAAGKISEGYNLRSAGEHVEKSAKAMMKAIEAKEEGNTTLAAEHTAAAEASQKKAEEAAQLAAQPVVQPPAPLPQPTQPVLQPPAPQKTSWFGKLFKK